MTKTEVFECASCNKVFTSKFSLSRHQLIHSNEKAYKCRFCGKGFALNQYRKEHECIHTGEKPYVCGVNGCQERFRQRGKLSLHRRRHEGYQIKKYHALQYDENGEEIVRVAINNPARAPTPNSTIRRRANSEEEEEFHTTIQVAPSHRSLRKRTNAARYTFDEESPEELQDRTMEEEPTFDFTDSRKKKRPSERKATDFTLPDSDHSEKEWTA